MADTLARLQRELSELGEVTTFAPNAGEVLANGIEQMNAAAAKLETRSEDVTRAQADLDASEVEEVILKEATAIAGLGSPCGSHPNHAREPARAATQARSASRSSRASVAQAPADTRLMPSRPDSRDSRCCAVASGQTPAAGVARQQFDVPGEARGLGRPPSGKTAPPLPAACDAAAQVGQGVVAELLELVRKCGVPPPVQRIKRGGPLGREGH